VECPEGLTPAPATLVTGYIHAPSKHSVDDYFKWISNYMELNTSIIMYVDLAYMHKIKKLVTASQIVTVPMSLSQFKSTACGMDVWQRQHEIDCENHFQTVPLVSSIMMITVNVSHIGF
jgi:hypothetical protein